MNLQELQTRLDQIELDVVNLQNKTTFGKTDYAFNEFIRDISFPDVDNATARSTTTTLVDAGHPATFPKVPDLYGRVVVKGRTYNLGLYNIT